MLDIVIGVVFVWLLMSVILATIGEGFSLLTHLRAKHLWLGIGRLLDPNTMPLPRTFADAALKVPLLGQRDVRPKALATPETSTANRFTKRPDEKEPHLASVRQQTQRVYDALAPQLTEIAAPGRLSKVTKVAGDALADAIVAAVRRVYPPDLTASAGELGWDDTRKAALQTALAGKQPGEELDVAAVVALSGPALSEADLRALYVEATERLTARDVAAYFANNPQLGKALTDAAAAVGGTGRVTAVKQTIDRWFDREMDQISAFYRRQNRKILAVLALPLVLVLQGNAIGLVQNLHHDANLRQAVSSAAVNAAAQESIEDAVASEDCRVPSTTTTTDPVTAASARFACAGEVIGRASRFQAGWAWQDFKDAHGTTGSGASGNLNDVGPFLVERWAWIGRPLTWIALLFGAQFWFDALRRLVGLRSTLGGTSEKSGGARG
ncbi:MAG: hypothetical protein LC733_07855 [Actinobacteria bacterium]|nr:hypothetical protein [Actinomycetota bacterium]